MRAKSVPPTRMDGAVVVVSGASSGIGAAAARHFSSAGATVAVIGRNADRTREVARECGADATAFVTDFASLAAVADLGRRLHDKFPRIDVLANNAGLIAPTQTQTVDGLETTFAINHVATFLLTALLEPSLKASPGGRVITTSSSAHSSGRLDRPFDSKATWTSWGAYADSKLANIAFTTELNRRLSNSAVTAHCFHPGVVNTRFGSDTRLLGLFQKLAGPLVLRSPERGAETLTFLATGTEPSAAPGRYWVNGHRAEPKPNPTQLEAETLWTRTLNVVKPHAS